MGAVLLTGATGFVGRAFTRALLEQLPPLRLYALTREHEQPWHRRLGVSEALAARVTPLRGDLRREQLALSEAARACLSDEAQLEVWHIGSLTELAPTASEATLGSNTLGTAQLLRMLSSLGTEVTCLNLVSTLGVAGRTEAPAIVPEALVPRRPFWSAYQESKYWAELLVANSGLPYEIRRLPTMVGDAGTGACDQRSIYALFAALCSARSKLLAVRAPLHLRVRARPDATSNLMCIDDGINLLLELRAQTLSGGSTRVCNLSNPEHTEAGALLEVCAQLLGLEIELDPSFEPTPQSIEAELDLQLEPLRPYLLGSAPYYARMQMERTCSTKPRPIDAARLRFLLLNFLERRPDLRAALA